MFRRIQIRAMGLMAISGLLGYAAASIDVNPASRAGTTNTAPTVVALERRGEPAAILNEGELAALAAHNGNVAAAARQSGKKPNICIIWGDDIGQSNLSCLLDGPDGLPHAEHRPHRQGRHDVHRLLRRAKLHRRPGLVHHRPARLRTGLTKVGLPGATLGLQKEDPTIAEMLKPLGYATGQFGKNHLGDRNEFLPTVHGFDEFYGNLYHLNAEEEPELPDYPKDPAFRARYGPRGVLDCKATDKDDETVDPRFGKVGKQIIKDTGPLTKKRMETIDDDVADRAVEFIKRQAKADKPFFVWVNFTHMHLRTHVKPGSRGQSGRWMSEYADVMIDHDKNVGTVLKALDDAGIADNTFVMYSTDNGPHMNTWPDGAHDAVPQREELELGRRLSRALHGPLAGQDQAGHRFQRRSSATTTGCRRFWPWPATPT